MKILLTICMLIAATCASANEISAPIQPKAAAVKGEVLEVINVQNFTYLKLKTEHEEIWTAVISSVVKKGSVVTIEDAIVMNNFESKTLKRTFSVILFGKLGGAQTGTTAPSVMGSSLLAQKPKWSKNDQPNQPVAKASGVNAHTVAEIVQKRSELNGKTVSVRGKVVKYNPDVMGKNWVHIQDGSGVAKDNSNDILVTTQSAVKIGEIVTLQGVVRIDQDFGAGYAYPVLVEQANLQ